MTLVNASTRKIEAKYSLFQQLKPEVVADPFPFFRSIREYDPVRWDPYMHSWVVTSYSDCVTALSKFSAARTPTPEYMDAIGLSVLGPYASLMKRQILFMHGPDHTQLRTMCMVAFTPRRVEAMREHVERCANELIDQVIEQGSMDVIRDFSGPLPVKVLALIMGFPVEDWPQLKRWATDIGELLGNVQHNPDRVKGLVSGLENMQAYIESMIHTRRGELREGVLSALLSAEVNGVPMSEMDVVANTLLIWAGGVEEPSNLIGCGLLTLLRRPEKLAQLRDHPEIIQTSVEELLRFESPTQHTGRVALEDVVLGGKQIRKGDLVTVVIAAANRDPSQFSDPDELDLTRADNRHLAFGFGSHYCVGAPLTRLTVQGAFTALLKRLRGLSLANATPEFRGMATLRGLVSLPIEFEAQSASNAERIG